jgi:ferredoxin
MAGGSTVVSCGNAVRCLEDELADMGITLDQEFRELETEMGVSTIADKLLSEGSERILWASQELGYKMERMPKFIAPDECSKCGQCVLGCAKGAKWTALDYLDEAIQNGAEIAYNTQVRRVLIENGKAKRSRPSGHTAKPKSWPTSSSSPPADWAHP